jgi:hypothetical protein
MLQCFVVVILFVQDNFMHVLGFLVYNSIILSASVL